MGIQPCKQTYDLISAYSNKQHNQSFTGVSKHLTNVEWHAFVTSKVFYVKLKIYRI